MGVVLRSYWYSDFLFQNNTKNNALHGVKEIDSVSTGQLTKSYNLCFKRIELLTLSQPNKINGIV